MNWKDIYKLPFKIIDEKTFPTIVDTDDKLIAYIETALDHTDDSIGNVSFFKKVLEVINGTKKNPEVMEKWRPLDGDKTTIVYDNSPVVMIEIRGWGYLTGICGLLFKNACEVQDTLVEMMLEKLNDI